MTLKSQALMLADKLDEGNIDRSTLTEAANELRRLDDINNDLMATLRWYIENDDVLLYQDGNEFWADGFYAAQAAIAKSTGEDRE
jgi:hypothetical protein